MYSCECGRTPPHDYEFCGCGRPITHLRGSEMHDAGSRLYGNNQNGVQAGRDVTAHQIIFGKDPTDPYQQRTTIERQSQKRSFLPDNWVTAAASLCTIASFLFMAFAWKPDAAWLSLFTPLVGLLSLSVLTASLYLRFVLQPEGLVVQPFGAVRSVYEKTQDGTVYSTRWVADCPWCNSNGQDGKMFMQTRGNGIHWVCRRNQVQHLLGFDPTTIRDHT
jgi:hypothetical protein